jgi:hypothetical protein
MIAHKEKYRTMGLPEREREREREREIARETDNSSWIKFKFRR